VVLLNKTDLVTGHEISKIKTAVKVLNPSAKISVTKNAQVNLKEVVQTKLFRMDEAERSAGWLKSMKEEMLPESEEYGISSFVYRARYALKYCYLKAINGCN